MSISTQFQPKVWTKETVKSQANSLAIQAFGYREPMKMVKIERLPWSESSIDNSNNNNEQ